MLNLPITEHKWTYSKTHRKLSKHTRDNLNWWAVTGQSLGSGHSPNISTTPITAMGCRQCLPLSVVQLKGKHCRKCHCHNGVVDTFGHCISLTQNSKSECLRAGNKNKIRASVWPKKERNADFLATSTTLSFGDLGKPPNA